MDTDSYCSNTAFIAEQMLMIIASTIMIVIRYKINLKVENIQMISDLDLKIKWSYQRYLSQIKLILYSIWIF
jgi:hypothetical protein